MGRRAVRERPLLRSFGICLLARVAAAGTWCEVVSVAFLQAPSELYTDLSTWPSFSGSPYYSYTTEANAYVLNNAKIYSMPIGNFDVPWGYEPCASLSTSQGASTYLMAIEYAGEVVALSYQSFCQDALHQSEWVDHNIWCFRSAPGGDWAECNSYTVRAECVESCICDSIAAQSASSGHILTSSGSSTITSSWSRSPIWQQTPAPQGTTPSPTVTETTTCASTAAPSAASTSTSTTTTTPEPTSAPSGSENGQKDSAATQNTDSSSQTTVTGVVVAVSLGAAALVVFGLAKYAKGKGRAALADEHAAGLKNEDLADKNIYDMYKGGADDDASFAGGWDGTGAVPEGHGALTDGG